jgi:hypothetical protein
MNRPYREEGKNELRGRKISSIPEGRGQDVGDVKAALPLEES